MKTQLTAQNVPPEDTQTPPTPRVTPYAAVRALLGTGLHSLDISSNAITEDGIYQVAYYLQNNLNLPYATGNYPIWGSSDLIRHISDQVGTEDVRVTAKGKTGYRGKFTKRLSQFIKDAYDVKLSPEHLDRIGSLAASYREAAGTVYFDLASEFDWSDGMFGKEGSCWWDGDNYGGSRNILRHLNGMCLRFYASPEDYQLYLDGETYCVGTGRVWLGKITLEDTQTEPEALVLFNAYGPYSLRQAARLLKTASGLDCGLVRLDNISHSDDFYINEDKGYALTHDFEGVISGQNFAHVSREDVTDYYDTEKSVTCYDCHDRVDEDDAYTDDNGDSFCEHCYHERYVNCDGCEDYTSREDAIEVDNDTLCHSCLRRRQNDGDITHCYHCEDLHYTRNMQDVNGDMACTDCLDEHATTCPHCHDLFWTDDINRTTGLCEDCQAEANDNQESEQEDDQSIGHPTPDRQSIDARLQAGYTPLPGILTDTPVYAAW